MPKNIDYPFDEICSAVKKFLDKGITVHQKWTCDYCGARNTMEEPNKMFTSGACEDCGKVTNIKKRGCNYLLMGPVETVMEILNQKGDK